MPFEVRMNPAAWADIERQAIEKWAIPATEKIAAACNEQSVADGGHQEATTEEERAGYRAGTEGDPSKTLDEGSYRATVITATNPAKADNARNNRLVNNLHIAEPAH